MRTAALHGIIKMGGIQSEYERLKGEAELLQAQITQQETLICQLRQSNASQEEEKQRRELQKLQEENNSLQTAIVLSLEEDKKRQLAWENRLMEAKDLERWQREQQAKLQNEIRDLRTMRASEERKKKEKEAKRLERIQEIRAKAKNSGIDFLNYFNIAIIGQAGTGKSAFYNAVTGHNLDEKSGLAETTKKPEFRTGWMGHARMDKIRIWDIPGFGTKRFPVRTYFEDLSLFCYDFLIIVVGNRFTEWDVAIYRRAIHYRVNTVFIRSKSDQEVNNASEKLFELPFSALQPDQKNRVLERVSEEVQNYFMLELTRCGVNTVEHFFVSSMAIIRKRPEIYPLFDEEKLINACDKQCRIGKVRIINLDEVDIRA